MRIVDARLTVVPGRGQDMLLVVVQTDEGVHGLGEIGVRTSPGVSRAVLEHLRGVLIGADATRIEHLWQTMSRGDFFPADRSAGCVISAIDIALWDIRGKAYGVPVYELIGGRVRDYVTCYTHVHPEGHDTEAVVASSRQLVAEGWRNLRLVVPTAGEVIEPRQAMRVAIEQFHAVRDAVGNDVELVIDAHTRLDPPEAVTLCRELESARPYFVEDVLRSEDLEAYRMLRSRTAVPLAAGEQLTSKWQFRALIEGDLIDHARIDLGIAGGITEARKIAAMAEAHHLKIATHNPLGPVSTAAAMHFNLTCPNFGLQEMPPQSVHKAINHPHTLAGGNLSAPRLPGLGVDLDHARIEAATGPSRTPQMRRLDGSFTNW
ncbi:mandelate racemase/muconate lactonizing enzyme family protein [Kribbella solani]|uniref:mandelate racemase/muconate lactonizing enzyme family protein n=1 Tax=Kribbella solani TaxID=236067 RepID=UPI0029A6361D|nr:mandelate racemase/muconate lactonizing enzyme family protein [Kribbella solani]MDX2971291.1 mandelate racemase/muconate lactonizing enzyme family protein [Kribbella solani]MDX3005554.1 mandelate racemase/muconate lactonizing enzyme family protein [Kribbella solani]